MTRSPRLARLLLTAVTPAEERDFVLGDLEEEYARRVERDGGWRASAWYWTEALRSAPAMWTWNRTWRGIVMTGWGSDLRSGVRLFTRSPGLAAVVVLTLAIGVGGATAVYSVVRGVVMTPLSFEESERVVMLWGQTSRYPRMPLTVGDHNVLVQEVDAFEAVAAEWGNTALLLGEGDAEQVSVGWVTPDYFEVLRTRPELGRALDRDDTQAVVVSHDLWIRRWGGDASIVGRVVDLSGERFEVVGVLGAEQNPNLSTFSGRLADHDVWRLQPADWTRGDDRSVGWLRSNARLRDGVTLAAAQQEVDALMARVNETVVERDGGTDLRVNLIPARRDIVGSVSRTLWILLAAVIAVLLIASTNVAHLMLGRAEFRSGEVALRAALGGSRGRLVRQHIVESAMLAAAGGAAGVAGAWWGLGGLLALAPRNMPRLDLVRMDSGVLLFALGATTLTTLLFGVVPASRGSRVDLALALTDGRSTASRVRQGLSRVLVTGQVALSLALVAATGLLLRSIDHLGAVDLGFEAEGVMTFALEAPEWGDTGETARAKMTAFEQAMEGVPGIRVAGFTNRVPLAGGLFTGTYRSEEMVAAEAEALEGSVRYVTPGYVEAMGARIETGRGFRSDDGIDVVLLDRNAADRLWPGEDPIGRRIENSAIGEEETFAEVVGVLAPMKHAGVALASSPTVFLPMLARAHQQNFRYAAIRSDGDPAVLLEPLREAVRSVDASAVIARPRTMTDLVAEDVAPTRFATTLLLLFGVVALVLAAVGLHGVMAFAVRRRRREMGIRLALGADRSVLLGRAVRSGSTLVAVGLALGLALALALGRLLDSLLFGVGAADPLTLAGSALVIGVVGVVGSYLPARLVLAVDPVATLREE